MHALITNVTGLRNRGVEALVVPTIEQMRSIHDNLEITLLTRTPDYDAMRLKDRDIQVISDSPLRGVYYNFQQKVRAKLSSIYPPLAVGYQSIQRLIKRSSVVIATGGDVFSSDYGLLHFHFMPLIIAIEVGVPVVFLAHSIGPFKTNDETQAWMNVAKRSALISVREKLSYNYLIQELKLSQDIVRQTADTAFLLEPPSSKAIEQMIQFYCGTEKQPRVAIAVSRGITHFTGSNRQSHINAWKFVVQMLLNDLKAQVLIVPHVQENYPENDDRIEATELVHALAFDPRVRVVGMDHSASELKGIISHCDLVIAERMHAAIAGLSTGVCTIAIGYSVKAKGIMVDLLGEELVDNRLLISIQDFLKPEIALETIRKAWDDRAIVSSELKKVLPKVKRLSASNFDLIARILGGRLETNSS